MLASLQPSLPAALRYEIVWVDDGSTDGTREWLRQLSGPHRVLLNEHNVGYAAANNRGAAIARGPNLLLLNNDVLLSRDWLQPMLQAQAHLGTRAGLIGNVQRSVATGDVDHCGIQIDAKGKPAHDHSRPWRTWLPLHSGIQIVPAVTGACVLVRRADFLAEGGFCEQYHNGGEDVDLAFRLERRGKVNAVALRSVIRHHVSASPGRKRHDELNTWRLVRTWRRELVQHGLPAWAWAHLHETWTSPSSAPDAWPALRLLAYALGLSRQAPDFARVGMHAALDREEARWRELFPDSASTV